MTLQSTLNSANYNNTYCLSYVRGGAKMSVFVISFRVGDVGDRNSRWSSIVEKIREEAIGSTWEETTSFFVIKSQKTSESLANDIYLKSEMHSDWDKLLVINLSQKGYATRGKIDYSTTLESLMLSR